MNHSNIVTKIMDGTRTSGNGVLCNTCVNCTRAQGVNDHEEVRFCRMLNEKLKFEVVRCSGYYSRSLPSIHDLYEIAWILETSKNRRTIGFVHYRDWKNPDKDVIGY